MAVHSCLRAVQNIQTNVILTNMECHMYNLIFDVNKEIEICNSEPVEFTQLRCFPLSYFRPHLDVFSDFLPSNFCPIGL